MASKSAKSKKRTSVEIAAELEARRTRIAGNVRAIEDAVRPARLVHKTISRFQNLFSQETVKEGSDKLAGVVSSVVGLIGLARTKKD